MNFINRSIYGTICLFRNRGTLELLNDVINIENYNMIIPNLYLGNINGANDIKFLEDKKIGAIINCTENEPFHEYFNDKSTLRISVNDSQDGDNIVKFRNEIINSIDFIDEHIKNGIPVYVHCYFGVLRSATVVASYIKKKYNMKDIEAINIVKERRPWALNSLYNFNEIISTI